jgi:hypothetical protein
MTIMKKKCNKWTLVFLFYSLFIFNNLYKTAVNAAPEKLTPEEVLEELGVKIETKEWSYSVTGVEGNLIELPCNASTPKMETMSNLSCGSKTGRTNLFIHTITGMEVTVIGQMTLFYEAELYFWPNTTQPD